MYEESCALTGYPLQELPRTSSLPSEALELPHHPGTQCFINIVEHWSERRCRVPPVVLYPTPQDWIELARDIRQRHVCAASYVQVPDRLPHRLHRRWADRWREAAEQFSVPIHRSSWSETV